jgi:hypothetical protein
MATGTGNLPYTMPPVSPFDVITSQAENEKIANIESLADGTGIGDKSVTLPAINGGTTAGTLVTDASGNVTASPGFKIGIIAAATLGSKGKKSITGVGFKPRLVRFQLLPSASTSFMGYASGAMTSTSQYFSAVAGVSNSSQSRYSATNRCFGFLTASTGSIMLEMAYVSMDNDGFSINVITASSAFSIAYEAYA